MNLLARFLICIFLCKMCHLLLKLHIYVMQKLLWQSRFLINRRISRCIRTLKHLHLLAAIVLIISITFSFECLEHFFLKLFSSFYCIHYANLSQQCQRNNHLFAFLFAPSCFFELCQSGNSEVVVMSIAQKTTLCRSFTLAKQTLTLK